MDGENNGLHLVKVNSTNFDELIDLEVNEEQKEYVADNVYSLAEAFAVRSDGKYVQPFGICDKETPVGFLMIGYDITECWERRIPDFSRNSYLVWRFMIDKKYQGKGYGREAMRQALDFIKTFPAGKADCCWLSYEPENEVAKKLYASYGFEERPDFYIEGDEMPAVLKL